MANFIGDDIDFSAYMNLTEHGHRVIASGEYAEEVVDYFWSEKVDRGQTLPWEGSFGKLAFRPGEVTIWSGFNGHGKSLGLGQTCIGLVAQAQRMCIASLEMKPVVTLARMCRQASGGSRPDPDFIRAFHTLTDKYVWMYDQQGMVSPDKIIGVINYAATEKKITHFIVDSFLKCGLGEDDYNGQKHFVDRLCTVARDTGVHVHLVAHSKKKEDENKPPRKMDVRGAGSITDQVDNVIVWWRNKAKEEAMRTTRDPSKLDDWRVQPDAVLICDKQRNGDWEGRLSYWFDPASMQFVENHDAMPMDMLRPRVKP
jgi:twinkle protein